MTPIILQEDNGKGLRMRLEIIGDLTKTDKLFCQSVLNILMAFVLSDSIQKDRYADAYGRMLENSDPAKYHGEG